MGMVILVSQLDNQLHQCARNRRKREGIRLIFIFLTVYFFLVKALGNMSGYIILSQLRLPSPTSVWCVSGEGLVLQLGLGRPVPSIVLVAKLCARKQPPTAGNEFLLIAAVPGAGLPCLSSEGRKTKTLKNGVMSRSSYLMRGNAAFFYLKAQIFFSTILDGCCS